MKHFKLSEFNCPCCGENGMKTNFLNKLDEARELAGIPFRVNSGYRCWKHNLEVKGSPTSSHLTGWAADIRVGSDHHRFKMVLAAMRTEIHGIGVYTSFLHLACDPDKSQERLFRGKD